MTNGQEARLTDAINRATEQLRQIAADIRELARAERRAELGEILRGLVARGVIGEADAERVEKDEGGGVKAEGGAR